MFDHSCWRKYLTGCCLALAVFPLSGALWTPGEDPGSSELRRGDSARQLGNITAAEKLYREAQRLSANETDSSVWQQAVLRLGSLALENKQPAAARAFLKAFQDRFPARSAGTLPGELLLFEGDLAGAEAAFSALIQQQDPAAEEARFHLAKIRSRQQRYDEALAILTDLISDARHPWLSRQSLYEKAQVLMTCGRLEEAAALLDPYVGNQDPNISNLRLLCAVKSKDLEYVKKAPQPGRETAHPDEFLYYLWNLAAALAQELQDYDFAGQALQNAYLYSAGEPERMEIFHRLFTVLVNAEKLEQAAQTIEKYIKLFPDAPDRAVMLVQCGRLLANAGMIDRALGLFELVVNDVESLTVERFSACADAARSAEEHGRYKEAGDFYLKLRTLASLPEQQLEADRMYGEYLLRRQDPAGAETVFRKLYSETTGLEKELSALRLLQSLIGQNRLQPEDLAPAQLLSKSEDPDRAEFGAFQLAVITALDEKQLKAARKMFLDFALRYPRSANLASARLQAAHLAQKLGDFKAAYAEYTAFAKAFPQHADAPEAWFRSLENALIRNDLASAGKVTATLLEKYPASAPAQYAVWHLAEAFLQHAQPQNALELLDAQNPEQNEQPESRMLRARTLAALGQYRPALAELDLLLAAAPKSAAAPDAAFMAGNLAADTFAWHQEAIKYFERSLELRSGGIMAQAALGRIGDSNYALYFSTQEKSRLLRAQECYGILAENAVNPQLKLQSMFKLSRCLELQGEYQAALDMCVQLLLLAQDLHRGNQPVPQVWCEQALYEAGRLALLTKKSASAQQAMSLFGIYQQIFTGQNADLQALRQSLMDSFDLLNQGVE